MGSFHIEFREGLLISRFSGAVDFDLVLSFFRIINEKERAQTEALNRFHDLTQTTTIDLDFEQIFAAARNRAKERAPLTEPVKVAFLVSGELAYGLVRIYESALDDPKTTVRAFYDIQEAANWLGVDAGILRPRSNGQK